MEMAVAPLGVCGNSLHLFDHLVVLSANCSKVLVGVVDTGTHEIHGGREPDEAGSDDPVIRT